MIQYKLIQKYPDSPKIGTIHTSGIGICKDWKGTIFYDANPKYWKKVDYEILSFKRVDTNESICDLGEIIIQKGNNEFWEYTTSKSGYSLGYLLKSKLYSIHSVERLSDGEVFTIGDKIKVYSYDFPYKVRRNDFVVTKIELDSNKISLHGKTFSKIQLEIANKVKKQPLFTTEDGVDVFEEDFKNHANIYSVNKSNFKIGKNTLGFTVFTDNYLKFSTKEKAEEYILLNKPCLSLNEIVKTIKLIHWVENQELIHIAKSKL